MDKHAIALVLEEIGTLLDLHGENSFKARAFQSAARAIESVDEDVVGLARRGELETVPGIGSATARVIRELIDTGTSKYYHDLRARTPNGFYELLAVPKLGPKKIRLLHEQLGVNSVADLERAAREGQISKLKGFGGRTEALLLEGIAYVRGTLGRRRLAEALDVGPRLLGFVRGVKGVIEAELAGELRRKLETVDGISIVAAAKEKDFDAVLGAFIALPGLTNAERVSLTVASARLSDGFTLKLECCPPDEFGTKLIRETGSADHVRTLGDPFITMRERSEVDAYKRLGLPFIEPELRESGAEVEAARQGLLPDLVADADLRGCFHCHTVYSDGRHTIEEMARAAQQRKWRYIGIADHSKNASYAGGLVRADVERQQDEIDASNAERVSLTVASARLSDGFTLKLECCPPDEFGTKLIRETGSADHVKTLGDPFITMRARSEVDAYKRLGLPFIEPELRESGAEVEAARQGLLPDLVADEDLRGCFHCHTVYSDGRHTVEEMARAAQERKWRYLGIADHSKNASYAGGLVRADVERQQDEIDAWNAEHGSKVWVFKGIEADILSDGRLDYEDEEGLLETFDFVIGSIHSAFQQPEAAQTARLIRAMQNPNLTFLGHMTGRLLLSRAGYRVDVEAVLDAAAELGVAVEINADPHRLDLDWRHWPGAKRRGVKTAINPDAHSARSLEVVEYGVCMARKGWLEPADVVNTWTLPNVRKFLGSRKKR